MLSSGQRQLISFVRAYINEPSILILDEATSNIDSESELLIQRSCEKITQEQNFNYYCSSISNNKKC